MNLLPSQTQFSMIIIFDLIMYNKRARLPSQEVTLSNNIEELMESLASYCDSLLSDESLSLDANSFITHHLMSNAHQQLDLKHLLNHSPIQKIFAHLHILQPHRQLPILSRAISNYSNFLRVSCNQVRRLLPYLSKWQSVCEVYVDNCRHNRDELASVVRQVTEGDLEVYKVQVYDIGNPCSGYGKYGVIHCSAPQKLLNDYSERLLEHEINLTSYGEMKEYMETFHKVSKLELEPPLLHQCVFKMPSMQRREHFIMRRQENSELQGGINRWQRQEQEKKRDHEGRENVIRDVFGFDNTILQQ